MESLDERIVLQVAGEIRAQCDYSATAGRGLAGRVAVGTGGRCATGVAQIASPLAVKMAGVVFG
ncbi:MAG: hypothetical protein ACREQ4_12340 [Candidatus Binataceae bacterium]